MSIAKIREALEHMKAIDTGDEMPKAMAALAEVEAIEKAAKIITVDGHGTVGDNPQFRAWADAMTLLESIAREAK